VRLCAFAADQFAASHSFKLIFQTNYMKAVLTKVLIFIIIPTASIDCMARMECDCEMRQLTFSYSYSQF